MSATFASTRHIVPLTRAHDRQAVELLTTVFRAEPWFQSLVGMPPVSETAVRWMFRLHVWLNRFTKQPIHGCFVDGRLAGVVVACGPEPVRWARLRLQAYAVVARFADWMRGRQMRSRMERYGATTQRLRPFEWNRYLLMSIAVAPDCRRLGIASDLLETVHQRVQDNERASGVWACTASPRAAEWLRGHGYDLYGPEAMDAGVDVWAADRPERDPPPPPQQAPVFGSTIPMWQVLLPWLLLAALILALTVHRFWR